MKGENTGKKKNSDKTLNFDSLVVTAITNEDKNLADLSSTKVESDRVAYSWSQCREPYKFQGISSSSDPSAISVKVSIGKRCYRTQDKGDFSFPIAKLTEELAVTLVDEEENEIAYTGIRVLQIIQKGTWDDIFSLEGGGQIHLKLRFFLNEEEQNRIRVMRESVMKKNLASASNINLIRSESTSSTHNSEEKPTRTEQNASDSKANFAAEVVSREAEASPVDSPSSSVASSIGSTSGYQKEEEIIQETENPEAETQSSQEHKTTSVEAIEMELPAVKSKDQNFMEKTPSNVRKMISAFESGQLKDVKSLKRPASVLPEQMVFRKEHSLEGLDEKGVAKSTTQSLRKAEVAHLTGNLSQNLINRYGQEDLVSGASQPFSDLKKSKSSIARLEFSMKPTVEKSKRSPVALTGSDIPEQDVEKSLEKKAFAQLEQSIAGKQCSLEDKDEKGVTKLTYQISREFEDTPTTGDLNQMIRSVSGLGALDSRHTGQSLAPKDLQSTLGPMKLSAEESDRSPVYLIRQPVSETATCSGREYEAQSQEVEAYDTSAVESETKTGLEGSKVMDIHGTSDQKPESLDYDREEYNSPENSGLWIFPHNVGRLCITTAGNQGMKIIELQRSEANTHLEKEVFSESEILELQDGIHERNNIGNMPESGSSPEDSGNRLIGQAIKIAVILGFGVLVLLTRKKEPR
ncbi:hypothetical protein F511_17641 [Dorcoceras hygrometricum]|uniref:Uncharacterized protein n=1 Tax=Dorcoceras hygrometricum TaxID=472368 RepID=A0A2Z7AJA6_9LAMI|nr:hypothetical protein F511_17641 [Dorcoceras hygrometricum]